jgi:hypothetical protein
MTELRMSAVERMGELGTSTLSDALDWEARAKYGYHSLQALHPRGNGPGPGS